MTTVQKGGLGMPNKVPEWKRQFIVDETYNMSDRDIAKAIDLPITSIQNIRLSKGLKRNIRNTDPERKLAIVTMLEDYWCNYTCITVLAKKYKMDTSNIARQIQHLFKLPLNNSTKIIVLKSRV